MVPVEGATAHANGLGVARDGLATPFRENMIAARVLRLPYTQEIAAMSTTAASAAAADLEARAKTNASDDRHYPKATLELMTKKYGGTAAGEYLEEVEHLELALDQEWPTWNSPSAQKRRWSHLPPSAMLKLKWLLKRRQLIMDGQGTHGIRMIDRGSKKPPLANPVLPTAKALRADSEGVVFRRYVSVPKIARDCGISLGRANEYVKCRDQDFIGTWVEWVEEKQAQEAEDEEVIDQKEGAE